MKRLIDRIRAERGVAAVPAEAQVIIGDDVLAGIDRQTEDRQWTAADFPNIAPPFAHTFIEARSLLAARELKAEYIMGLHIADSTQQMWNRRTVPDGQVRHPATKWILTLFGWSFIDRVLFQYPGFAFIHVAEDGRWLDDAQNVQCYIDTARDRRSDRHTEFVSHEVQRRVPGAVGLSGAWRWQVSLADPDRQRL